MKAVIQRTARSSVTVAGETAAAAGPGLTVLLGVAAGDAEADALLLAEKTANLRIFSNSEGKFDHSLLDVRGEALVISQFTLCADARRGRRPDFTAAARPEKAKPLYELFSSRLAELGVPVKTGVFAADMLVELANDGPVTIILDSKELK